jgi:hypothetical protein
MRVMALISILLLGLLLSLGLIGAHAGCVAQQA